MKNKKKWLLVDISILLLLAILVSLLYQTGKSHAMSDPNKSITLRIHTSKSLISNNSVGNEWNTIVAINKQEVNIGSENIIDFHYNDEIILLAAAEERDNISDRG